MKRYVLITVAALASLFATGCVMPTGLEPLIDQIVAQVIVSLITGGM